MNLIGNKRAWEGNPIWNSLPFFTSDGDKDDMDLPAEHLEEKMSTDHVAPPSEYSKWIYPVGSD